jgi:glycosyltransferase involved in cell wall biosynthesis
MIEIHLKLSVSVVIPAYNEAPFIATVIGAARSVPEVDEVLVVDDGSADGTATTATEAGARVVAHKENRGKGAAMRTGCSSARSDVLIYLDADLQNITPEKIQRIIEPFKKGFDFVKTRFGRRGGRVTQLTARPMLGHFFPEIDDRFDQPLSGQIGIKRELMDKLELEADMGVDLGLLIDAVEVGARVTEVSIGALEHDEREIKDLQGMAHAVSRVVLDRAARYHRVEEAIDQVVEVS